MRGKEIKRGSSGECLPWVRIWGDELLRQAVQLWEISESNLMFVEMWYLEGAVEDHQAGQYLGWIYGVAKEGIRKYLGSGSR